MKTSGYQLGYARVSTDEQEEALQVDALTTAGCNRIFVDKVSGVAEYKPELHRLLDQAREGDTLVVWRLDRLGRSVPDLIKQVGDLGERGIHFKSLTESIDTEGPGGRFIFHVFASLAEFERDLIRSRTNAGLAAARARGRFGGRPRALTSDQERAIYREFLVGDRTAKEIGATFGVSPSTVSRAIANRKQIERVAQELAVAAMELAPHSADEGPLEGSKIGNAQD